MSYHPFDSYAAAQRAITAVINSQGYAKQADWLRLEQALDAYREEQAARFPQSLRVISERATFVRGSRVSEDRA